MSPIFKRIFFSFKYADTKGWELEGKRLEKIFQIKSLDLINFTAQESPSHLGVIFYYWVETNSEKVDHITEYKIF